MLHYQDHNTNKNQHKPTVVLLHGFCENKSIWQSFVDEHTHLFRIICLDLAGFGESPISPKTTNIESINIETMATEVQETLLHLKVETCMMFGHSLGGYVTLAFAEKFSTMLVGIGLINSTAFADSEEKKQNRNKLIESLENYGVKPFLATFFNNLFYQPNVLKFEKEIAQLILQAQNLTAETVIQTTKAMRDRKDYSLVLKNLTIPVLFVVGKNDAILPLDLHKEQFYLPKTSLIYLLENVGHMAMFEAKTQLNYILKTFINLS
jgi:pimeloyl-ACP methyl ester carboxylesterase